MPKDYVIATINVTDTALYPKYVQQVLPSIQAFNGRFLVRGGPAQAMETPAFGDRHVVIEFPDVKAAYDWYDSTAYAPLKMLRKAASQSIQTIVEGV